MNKYYLRVLSLVAGCILFVLTISNFISTVTKPIEITSDEYLNVIKLYLNIDDIELHDIISIAMVDLKITRDEYKRINERVDEYQVEISRKILDALSTKPQIKKEITL